MAFDVCYDVRWKVFPDDVSNRSSFSVYFDGARSLFLQPGFIFPFEDQYEVQRIAEVAEGVADCGR